MALYNFRCTGPCRSTKRKILKADQLKTVVGKLCGNSDCGGVWEREPTGPTNQVYETLDNGLMPHKVERLADAERLFKERAKNNKDG
jgi:hypothetical protein